MKFLIDECLSLALVKLAHERGYGESSHVVWMGRAGWKDWELNTFIIEGDWTFVTRNAIDFRGPSSKPGTKGQYADVPLHAGLICFNGPDGMDLELQVELFKQALDELDVCQDLVNQVLEISIEDSDEFHILRYELPRQGHDPWQDHATQLASMI